MIHPLTGSVGNGGQNAPEDVRTVQKLLIAVGAMPGPVDGVCDSRTLAAIMRAQRPLLRHPDGRIDAHGGTWAYLQESEGEGLHLEPDTAPPPCRQPVRTIDEEGLTRWVSRDGNEVKFGTLEGTPPPRHWTHRPSRQDAPPGARTVPVVAPYATPLVPGGFDRMSSERVRFLDAIRTTIQRAGLDWDARVLLPLWANESNWDRSNWGNNVGNIKAQRSVYSPSFPHLVRTHTVQVSVPESVAVMVFVDRVNSIDGYHAFASAEDYVRYTARILRTYHGATAALQTGGIEGAALFARALQGGPRKYSPASVDSAVRMFQGCYRRSLSLIGEARFLP